jgi:hypothetical protein
MTIDRSNSLRQLELAAHVRDSRNAVATEGFELAADSDADLRLAMAAIALMAKKLNL